MAFSVIIIVVVREYIKSKFLKITLILTIIISFIFAMALGNLLYASTERLPRIEELLKSADGSTVYYSNGQSLAKIKPTQTRTLIPYGEISPHLINAVIAIEDERFFSHNGIDLQGILRALRQNITKQKTVEGGSTITQQLVKNIFMEKQKTVDRKLREALLALQLEQHWDKEEILQNYLNLVYFGKDCYGIGAAAAKFFGKKPSEITAGEAALLAGVIRSPINYSPYDDPPVAKERRDYVISKMRKLEMVTPDEAKRAKKTLVKLKPWKMDISSAPYFVDYLKETLITKYGADLILRGNLKIYSTLDKNMQAKAEAAIKNILNKKGDPSSAIVSIEPQTGYVKALVGGRDFRSQQFNLATQGRRQPGSAFKPFVLIAALSKGIPAEKIYQSTPIEFPIPEKNEIWKVKNYEGTGGNPTSLKNATIHSINTVYARLIMEIGAKNVIPIAKKMGIVSEVNPDPAISLGGLKNGVSPLEMASAYSTLANNGMFVPPTPYIKIINPAGKEIQFKNPAPKQVLSANLAFRVTTILKDVITKGTGTRAIIARPAAGKTGTTQNYRDAWFVGYTPQLSTAVWVGFPQAQIDMTNVHGIKVAGGTFPASIWSQFMYYALEKIPPSDFLPPNSTNFKRNSAEFTKVLIDPTTMKRATQWCPNPVEIELANKVIPPYCDVHKGPASKNTMPDVINMSLKDATISIEEKGFKAVIKKEDFGTDSVSGKVFDQSPSAGESVKRGAKVILYVTE